MLRILERPEPFLERGDYVYFIGLWTPEYADKVFEVKHTLPTKKDHFMGFIPPNYKAELRFKDTFEPAKETTLYQIRIGLKPSHIRMYFAFPSAKIRGVLERAPYQAIDPVGVDTKYLGAWEWYQTPWHSPRFETYGIKGHPIALYFSTDILDKLVITMHFNLIEMEEVTGKEREEVIKEKKYLPIYSQEVIPW